MNAQHRLFKSPETPAEYAAFWGVDLLDEIPEPGIHSDWTDAAEGSTRWPGRNLPRAGKWLLDRYSPAHEENCDIIADPMMGIGGIFLDAAQRGRRLYGCELEAEGVEIARKNLEHWRGCIQQGDARRWSPGTGHADLVISSFAFQNSHSSGEGEHQQNIREAKGAHAVMEFGETDGQIGRMRGAEYWGAVDAVCRQIRTYARGLVVLCHRNFIRSGGEADEISDLMSSLRQAGFEIFGLHVRDLERPTMFQQWKVAADPSTPWTRWEWWVVAR